MEAIAAYVETLRTKRGWNRKQASKLVGVSDNQIKNWEERGQEPGMGSFFQYVKALRGRIEDVWRLWENEQASPLDGENMANRILAEEELMDVYRRFRHVDKEAAEAALARLLSENPDVARYVDELTNSGQLDDVLSRLDAGLGGLERRRS